MAEAVESSSECEVHHAGAGKLRWLRACAIGVSLAFLVFAAKAYWANHFWLFKSDFVSFWAAGRLALAGQPILAYDMAAHHAAEQAAGHVRGLVPFPYPPPFLAIVTPFAIVPFGPSYFLWVGATAGLYLWSTRRMTALPFAAAMPPAYVNLLSGQTGFFFGGIFIAGISLVEAAPWFAGAILGLMVLKPQLALLLPVAMLAGRHWRVIGGAILSASALLLLALALFGWSSYAAFFAILPHYVDFMRGSLWSWTALISPFALARFVGLPQALALTVHVVVALGATIITARAWWLKLDIRLPVLAAATLLASPYVFTYDALLMVVPIAWLIRAGRQWTAALVWLCCLSPVLNYFTPYVWPNLVSPAAIICIWVMHRHSGSGEIARPVFDTQAASAGAATV
jgi:hypothetical protein